jgi:hypothetical protein
MSKDTVARALARLRAAGVVAASQTRTPEGAFGHGIYQIVVPDGIALERGRGSGPVPPTPRRAAPTTFAQLALGLDI